MEYRTFDGRDMSRHELATMRRIIDELNVEVVIEGGNIVIQARCEDWTVEPIAHCDLRRVAAFSAEVAEQDDGETGVLALAGLFSKCAQIVLNDAEPHYAKGEEPTSLGGPVRLFAGNDRENVRLFRPKSTP